MDSSEVAIATVTWARSADEEELLGRSLQRLVAAGFPVAIADRPTSTTFTRRLGELPGVRIAVPQATGLVAQVKASFAAAATFETRFILYVEPDKQAFFSGALRDFVLHAAGDTDVGVVLASRSRASFGTFPPMQQYTEGVINQLCSEFVGGDGDYSYGPFMMNRTLMPSLHVIPVHLGWGWRHFMFAMAARHGFRVLHVVGDYDCPLGRRAEAGSDRVHRLRQLSENLLGLIAAFQANGAPTSVRRIDLA